MFKPYLVQFLIANIDNEFKKKLSGMHLRENTWKIPGSGPINPSNYGDKAYRVCPPTSGNYLSEIWEDLLERIWSD